MIVDRELHPPGSELTCIYPLSHAEALVLHVQLKGENCEFAAIQLEVPPAGFMIFESHVLAKYGEACNLDKNPSLHS